MSSLTDAILHSWQTDLRWRGITRPYGPEAVVRLRGTIQIEYTLARLGADRFWRLLHTEPWLHWARSLATRPCNRSRLA
jgi:isocitrate lyase